MKKIFGLVTIITCLAGIMIPVQGKSLVSSNVTLKQIKTEITAFHKEMKKTKPGNTYAERRRQYDKLELTVEYIDELIDRYEDRIEAQYARGTISRSAYQRKDSKLELQEMKLDRIENKMELRFGIDD